MTAFKSSNGSMDDSQVRSLARRVARTGGAQRWRSLVVVSLLVISSACGSTETGPVQNPGDGEDLWAAADIAAYEWTYTSTCGESAWLSSEPVTVQVSADGTQVVDGPEPFAVATVQNVLDAISAAERDGADSIEASFGAFGQPTQVRIDYLSDAVDDEFCIDVSNFAPLEQVAARTEQPALTDTHTLDDDSAPTSDFGVPSEIDHAALTGAVWSLRFGAGPSGGVVLVPDYPIIITFDGNGAFVGTAGCNDYGGTYQIDLNELAIGSHGWEAELCEGAVAASEAAYRAGLHDVDGINLVGTELVLSGPSTELVFAATDDR